MSNAAGSFVDPGLSKALEQWQAFYQKSTQDAVNLVSAMSPMKDAAEVTQKVTTALSDAASSGKLGTPIPPEAFKELTQLQQAGAQRLWDSCTQALKDTRSYGEALMSFDQMPSSPQALLTHILETNLAAAKQYQADASAMASTMSEVQAAYSAWLDKYFLKVS